MGKICLGKFHSSVCLAFRKFLNAFKGDVVYTLDFLMQRHSSPRLYADAELKEDLIVDVNDDIVVKVYDKIDFFLTQRKLLSRADAVEMLVLGCGVEWEEDDSLTFVSEHGSKVFNKLNQERLDNKFCDIELFVDKADSEPFHAHKCMLAATSEYFNETLKQDTKVITISCLADPTPLSLTLQWLYTGAVTIDKKHCNEIQKLANFLRIYDLEQLCMDYFSLSYGTLSSEDPHIDLVISIEEDSTVQKLPDNSNQVSEALDSLMVPEENFCKNDSNKTFKPRPKVQKRVGMNKKRIRGKNRALHVCHICKTSFHTKSHLKRHMISHSGERKHCCTTCGKLFLKADHLTRHERTHSADRPFDCDQCDKKFKTKDNLKRHLQTHSDERPFFCEICAKQFKDKAGLLIHQKSHSKSEPVCPHCGKRFTQRNRLEYHIIRHTNPLTCDICGKTFTFQNHLHRHKMTHTGDRPFSCETCGRQFADSHGLKLHQKKHTGIGLHACPQCDRKFLDRFHLKRHMTMHTGEKPYKCETCQKTFSRADNCESHKKSCVVKVAMQKDMQSFTEQEGEGLKIKRVHLPKTEKTASCQLPGEEKCNVSQNVALAVNSRDLRTTQYKRIAKRPPQLKLILLKNVENRLDSQHSATVSQSNLVQFVQPSANTVTNSDGASFTPSHGNWSGGAT